MTYRVFISGQKHFGEAVLHLALDKGLGVTGISAPVGDRLWNAARASGIPVTEAGRTLDADRVPVNTDLIICAYSHEFVTGRARSRAAYGGVGYHPSLLPDLRGRRAVEAAICGGYFETGGSIYVLDDGYDTGAVLRQKRCVISAGETAFSLWRDKLEPIGLELYGEFFDELTAFGPLWDAGYIRAHYAPQAIEEC